MKIIKEKQKIFKIYFSRKKIKHFNEVDGKIDRTSLTGKYQVDQETNRPKNPQGRTGCMSSHK
jgi:hypothetical protein